MQPVRIDTSLLDQYTNDAEIAVRFQVNRQANFHFVLNIVSKVKLFQADKIFLALFERSKPQLQLLAVVLSEVKSWKNVSVYASGGPLATKASLDNLLRCYLTAASLENHEDHCHRIIKDPFVSETENATSLSIDLFSNEFWSIEEKRAAWVLPCQYLNGFLRFSKSDKPRAKEKFEAVATAKNCNLCPFFDSSKFREQQP